MSARRGFTLIELMVVVAIIGILAGLIVLQGFSARQNAGLAGSVYELTLVMQGLRGRAISESRDFVLVVVGASDADDCKSDREACAHYFVLRNPTAAFSLADFDPAAPYAAAERGGDDEFLPGADVARNDGAWTPPPPFSTGWTTGLATCKGTPCFGLRFGSRGDVEPEPPASPLPAGYSFLVNPVNVVNTATEQRGVFVSFPAGIVKTRSF